MEGKVYIPRPQSAPVTPSCWENIQRAFWHGPHLSGSPALLCSLHNLLTPGYTHLLWQILKAAFRPRTKPPDLLPGFLQGAILHSQPNPCWVLWIFMKDKYSMFRTKKTCSSNHQAGLLSYCWQKEAEMIPLFDHARLSQASAWLCRPVAVY